MNNWRVIFFEKQRRKSLTQNLLFLVTCNLYFRTQHGLMKCTSGYCCPNQNGCCINYMELWWFWCIWILIIAFSCFCAYHHHKVQSQPRDRPQPSYVPACSYPGPPADGEKDQLGYCKLPKVNFKTIQIVCPLNRITESTYLSYVET